MVRRALEVGLSATQSYEGKGEGKSERNKSRVSPVEFYQELMKHTMATNNCSHTHTDQNFLHLQSGHNHRSPMLLLTVIGCHFWQVFGAAWNGSKVCINPLCSPVSLLFVPHDPRVQVARTARVLAAIASTVDELKKYYSNSGRMYKGHTCTCTCVIAIQAHLKM